MQWKTTDQSRRKQVCPDIPYCFLEASMSVIMCQFCKCDGLHWKEDAVGKWRLHYSSGQLHTCRATRDKIAKSIAVCPLMPATQEQHLLRHFTKEGVTWMLRRKPKPVEIPPADWNDPFYDFLDGEAKTVDSRPPLARQQTFAEIVP